MHDKVNFRVLGELEVAAGGAPASLGGPRQRALLARLLLDTNRPVSAERLLEDAWGGKPNINPSSTVRSAPGHAIV